MKTIVYAIHSYGAYDITFKKEFDLPCAPFIGMFLLDEVGEEECQIEFAQNQYINTMIMYFATRGYFTVDVRQHWRFPVAQEVLDDILKIFTSCNWERTDHTDLIALRELMTRDTTNTIR